MQSAQNPMASEMVIPVLSQYLHVPITRTREIHVNALPERVLQESFGSIPSKWEIKFPLVSDET
jgi:hypothetical protein